MDINSDINIEEVIKVLERCKQMNKKICNRKRKGIKPGLYEKYTCNEYYENIQNLLIHEANITKDLVGIIIDYNKIIFSMHLYTTLADNRATWSNRNNMCMEFENLIIHYIYDRELPELSIYIKSDTKKRNIETVINSTPPRMCTPETWSKINGNKYSENNKNIYFQQFNIVFTNLNDDIYSLELYINELGNIDGVKKYAMPNIRRAYLCTRAVFDSYIIDEISEHIQISKDYLKTCSEKYDLTEKLLIVTNREYGYAGLIFHYLMILNIVELKDFVRQLKIIDNIFKNMSNVSYAR